MSRDKDTASPDHGGYPAEVVEEFERLARECYLCYQCGTCTSSCPSGRELYRGPRRLVRLILAGDIEATLKSDDLWRCTDCGTCSNVCRMEIDVAGILRRLRALERDHGDAIRCPERSAADAATAALQHRSQLDMLRFGLSMATRGHVPKNKLGAVSTAARLAKLSTPLDSRHRARPEPHQTAEAQTEAPGVSVRLPFYAGCALAQNRDLLRLVHDVAGGLGVELEAAPDAGCCGHPSRGVVASQFAADGQIQTVCPACERSLDESGTSTVLLWDTLTESARRRGLRLHAAAPRFVPYVGCLGDRTHSLATLSKAAGLAGVEDVTSYPSLHSGCCGALGGTYRGATKAAARLLAFAAAENAPIVSPCSLCADNLRSATRELHRRVPIYFWPEFFTAAKTRREDPTDD